MTIVERLDTALHGLLRLKAENLSIALNSRDMFDLKHANGAVAANPRDDRPITSYRGYPLREAMNREPSLAYGWLPSGRHKQVAI